MCDCCKPCPLQYQLAQLVSKTSNVATHDDTNTVLDAISDIDIPDCTQILCIVTNINNTVNAIYKCCKKCKCHGQDDKDVVAEPSNDAADNQ